MELFIEKLKNIKYYSGLEFEKKVKLLLESLNIKFIYQPNGTQRFPDFYLSEFDINLECKSSANDKPMWNCTYPKKGSLYAISCKKLDQCIVKFGEDIVTEDISKIYEEYASKHKSLEKEINDKLSKVSNNYKMRVYARNMYIQETGFSTNLLEKYTKEYKTKNIGQYFTSSKEILSKILDDYNSSPKKILEPSCGLGHILDILKPFKNIEACDIDQDVIGIAKNIFPNVSYKTCDFLTENFDKKYDLIVGNPPYFEINKKNIPPGFEEICSGRVNIYYLFIYKCINLLEDNGELRLVIPTSFLSNSYAESCRKYLLKECEIKDIVFFNEKHFEDAIQNVIILKCVKKNNPNNTNKNLPPKGIIIPNLKDLEVSGITIKSLGCSVKTGDIVWNKHKNFLDESIGNRLFYSSDLSEKEQKNPEKKSYLSDASVSNKLIFGPCVLVQRIIAEDIVYKFLDHNPEGFYAENHLNVISGDITILKKICKSFEDSRTSKFIKNVFKNNHLSKNELESVLQIYD
jgi:tRNA1(Val) A37 N6-methylase TrmN6